MLSGLLAMTRLRGEGKGVSKIYSWERERGIGKKREERRERAMRVWGMGWGA